MPGSDSITGGLGGCQRRRRVPARPPSKAALPTGRILGRVDIGGYAVIFAETIDHAADVARGARHTGLGGSTIVRPLLPREASG
jgi:hypothetical protein